MKNRSDMYFIRRSSCNLGSIGQTRRRLKARLDERLKVKNEEIYSSSIVCHCWSYNHYFDTHLLFSPEEVSCYVFRPETIVANFFHFIVLNVNETPQTGFFKND